MRASKQEKGAPDDTSFMDSSGRGSRRKSSKGKLLHDSGSAERTAEPMSEPQPEPTPDSPRDGDFAFPTDPETDAEPQGDSEFVASFVSFAAGGESPEDVENDEEDGEDCSCSSCGLAMMEAGLWLGQKMKLRVVPIGLLVFGYITTFAVFWSVYFKRPTIYEGAFGHTTSVNLTQPVAAGTFAQAQWSTVSSHDLLGPSADGLSDSTESYTWRRIIVMYKATFTNPKDGTSQELPLPLDHAHAIEKQLRGLDTWRQLCSIYVPENHRRLCDPGDSYLSVAFGSSAKVSPEGVTEGIVSNITFDGASDSHLVSPQEVATYLRKWSPGSIQRWFATGADMTNPKAFRTLFAFYLPQSIADQAWTKFITIEVEPVMASLEELEDIMVFFSADGPDGLEVQEFSRALERELPILMLSPLFTFLATMLVTQQLLVSLTAALVVVIAAAADALTVEMTHFIELPVMVLIAWGCNAVAATDIACACVRAADFWRHEARLPPKTRLSADDGTRWQFKQLARRVSWFYAEVYLPQLAIVAVLLLLSWTSMPLVNEWMWHTSVGLFLTCVYSAVLLPSAVRCGEFLTCRYVSKAGRSSLRPSMRATSSLRYDIADGLGTCGSILFNTFLPMEFGAKAAWKRKFSDQFAIFSLTTLQSFAIRVVAFVFVIFILIYGSCAGMWPEFHGNTPSLFVKGNRMYQWEVLRQLFDPLPAMSTLLQSEVPDLHRCAPDAHDGPQCDLFLCDATATPSSEKTGCKCYHSRQNAGLPCRGAAARLFGVKGVTLSDDDAWRDFWQQTNDRLQMRGWALNGTDMRNGREGPCANLENCVTVPLGGKNLALEDWETGSIILETVTSIGFTGLPGMQAPSMEDACDRLVCFCGAKECQITWSVFTEGSAWQPLSDDLGSQRMNWPRSANKTAAPGARRLHDDLARYGGSCLNGQCQRLDSFHGDSVLHRPSLYSGGRYPGSRRLSTTPTIDGTVIDVVVIFGLQVPKDPSNRASGVKLEFNSDFVFGDIGMQRSILAFCEGVHPALHVDRAQCWPTEFKLWLLLRSQIYPVSPQEFPGLFQQFMADFSTSMDTQKQGVLKSSGIFWLNDAGRVGGFYTTFEATIPRDVQIQTYMKSWAHYVELRNNMSHAQGKAWFVFPIYVEQEVIDVVQLTAARVYWHFIIGSGIATFIVTWSCGLALGVILSVAVSLYVLGIIAVGIAGRRVCGINEIIVMAAYLTFLTTQLMRVAQQYSFGQERAHKASASLVSMEGKASPHGHLQTAQHLDDIYWDGAVASERKYRAAGAVCRAADSALGQAVAGLFVGLVFMSTALEGLRQIAMAMMVGSVMAFPVALGLLPILFGGFGTSRVRRRAVWVVVKYIWKYHREKNNPDLRKSRHDFLTAESKEAMLAAEMLGWGIAGLLPGHGVQKHRKHHHRQGKKKKAHQRFLLYWRGQGKQELDPVDDHGPTVLSLKLDGATSMPPFHIAFVVKEKWSHEG